MSTRFCLYFYPTGNSLTTFKGKTVFQLGDSMNNLYFIQKQLFFWKYYVEILFSVQRKLIFSLKSFFFSKMFELFKNWGKTFDLMGNSRKISQVFWEKIKYFYGISSFLCETQSLSRKMPCYLYLKKNIIINVKNEKNINSFRAKNNL